MNAYHAALRQLASPEFEARFVASSPAHLRAMLRGSTEVCNLCGALRSGVVSDTEVRSFVADLLDAARGASRFPHQLALCSLAIAFESQSGELPDEFLRDLAALRNPAFVMASHLARLSMAVKSLDTSNNRKEFRAGGFSLTFLAPKIEFVDGHGVLKIPQVA